jgi:hypothetical protein
LNAFLELFHRCLIDPAPCAGNEFGIQAAMINAAGSGHSADKQTMKIS